MALDSTEIELGQTQLSLDGELFGRPGNARRVWYEMEKHPKNPLFERSGWKEGILHSRRAV